MIIYYIIQLLYQIHYRVSSVLMSLKVQVTPLYTVLKLNMNAPYLR